MADETDRERAIFHMETAIACLKEECQEDAGANADEELQILLEGKEDALELQDLRVGDIVEYIFYDDPNPHRAIVAWNEGEEKYVFQTFTKGDVEKFNSDGISDHCEFVNVYTFAVLGHTDQWERQTEHGQDQRRMG
jgi:hypothetical protein